MPKKFTDSERKYLIKRLKEEAMKCLSLYGVKKTTVDELVKRVNIPKGTFYLFYESKELILYDAINDLHDEMQNKLLKDMAGFTEELSVEGLTDFLAFMYKEVNHTGLLPIIMNGEMEYLMRRLPENLVKEHLAQDDLSIEKLFAFLPYRGKKNIDVFSGAFRGIFLLMPYKREIGDDIFDKAIKLMLRGLVIQMMEDNDHD